MQNFALLLEGTKWGLTSNTSMPSKMTSDRSQTEMIMSAVSQTRPVLDRATRVEKALDEKTNQEIPKTTNSKSANGTVEQMTSDRSQTEMIMSAVSQTRPVLDRATRVEKALDEKTNQEIPKTTNSKSANGTVEQMTSDRSQTEMIMSAVSQTRPVLDRATRVEKDLDEEMPQESPETTNSSSSKEVVEQVTSEKSQIERTVSGLNQTSPVLDVLPVFGQDQQSDVTLDDIQVHRDFYRFAVPTTQLAKVSKLLLSMQKGCLSGLQGKSLDEIALEGEIALSDAEAEDSQRESDDNGTTFTSHCGNIKPVDAASVSALAEEARDTEGFGNDAAQQRDSRRITKRTWSKAEVAAVMRHFRDHISKGKLATKNECSHCKLVEDPVLAQRTVQNIRDFVRNRGTAAKRQPQKHKL
ncbi:uncharacterized protein LOC115399798 [Salarias fasciatus]|uniref:uncharacterized protein LOC115399798 n=1 Tax=Salarias fasciatus TaxID=181472 RepID=UPI001176E776|nr:uncharacterized protein LOC115390956 isoform X2 [Salarias fasciatus]XP_029963229.1 uncharacterized protein LOC115399798 [Salarias fasciatus]